ncbi:hypothetical protein GW17_00023974 [Ensete ventricosum]|nr:hypothetical protein GW17_00023974 [Ensete ventricosum]
MIVEEEEGNNNIGCYCGATSWLQVEMVAAKVWLRQRDEGATACTTVAEESSGGMESATGNLLLVAKEVGSKRSPLAAIKEDGSERLLLAVLCGEGSLLVVIKVDGSIVQQEMHVVVEGINEDLVAERLSPIPYSHERRALIVKGTEEMENTDANSKYQDKVEGQRPRNFIRPMSTGFSSR